VKVGSGRPVWRVAVGRWSWSMVGCVAPVPATGVADPDLSVSVWKRTPTARAPTAGADVDDIAAVGLQAKRTGGWWLLVVAEGA
jgi:hypothetical protein